MLIKLVASKIAKKFKDFNNEPLIWNMIKYAAVQVDEIDEQHRQEYLNQLLHDLLSSKAHCFVSLDSDMKNIKSLWIASVVKNVVKNISQLSIRMFYGFETSSDEEWDHTVKVMKEFAAQQKCQEVIYITRNPKVAEVGMKRGFTESYRGYSFVLGGS